MILLLLIQLAGMHSESSEDQINQQLDFGPLPSRFQEKLKLSSQSESIALDIFNRRDKNVVLNRAIDPQNIAQRCPMTIQTKEIGKYRHFLTKNKNRDNRVQVFDVLRQLSHEKNINLNGRVKDKLQRSKMILRVINKEQASGLVLVEDQTGKEKMIVRNGTVWVGMITCMDVSWADGCYKLEGIFDLGEKLDNINQRTILREPLSAYRIIFLKGSFSALDSKQNFGLNILTNELGRLKGQRIKIDTLVIFGPLLNSKNTALKGGFSQLTFDEQAYKLTKLIKKEVAKISQQIQIVFVPSTDDLTNMYPIPQPKYNENIQVKEKEKNIHYTSNPGILKLNGRQNYEINLINSDILQYIDESRSGKAMNEILQENLQTYFKQAFYMTNALDQPFDQTNLPALYHGGKFGNIVVTTSHRDHPFARQVRGRVYVNIGSLGIDQINTTNKHYMTLLSIYDGQGPVGQRTKVESLIMG